MFNFLNNNFEVRCGKGCEEAYKADIKSIRKNIEDIMLQYNCKNLDVYHWDNYLVNPCDNLPNMMQNSNGYDLCNTYVYNNTSHEVNINTKLSVKKKDNKMHIIFIVKKIKIGMVINKQYFFYFYILYDIFC